MKYSASIVAINSGISNPNCGYMKINNAYECWNKGNTYTGVNNFVVHKTIFDPSPLDYKLPRAAAYSGFAKNGNNTAGNIGISTESNAYYFYTLGWQTGPLMKVYCLGDRNAKTQNLVAINSMGVYWLSSPISVSGIYFYVGSEGFWPADTYEAPYEMYSIISDHE